MHSSSLPEKLFVASRLAPEMVRGDAESARSSNGNQDDDEQEALHADAGQLLYVLDSFDFARFMRRYNSDERAENYRTFEDPTRWDDELVMQWQNKKAVKRTRTALPIVH